MLSLSRQSNFELLRLVCMFMVLICHANGYINESDLVGVEGVIRVVINQLIVICVNVFVMISGWFGIKATWKGAMTLFFQSAFLGLLCFSVLRILGLPVSFSKGLLPCLLLGYGYWFVVAYIILYAISPVLNKFCENATKKEFQYVLAAFFIAEFVYGYLLDVGHFSFGFSPLFFIGLYLLARYAHLYPGKMFSLKKGYDLSIYFILSITSMFGLWYGYKWFGMGFHLNHYDSPLTIAASLFFLLYFSKLKFQSKTINWLAISAFAIYLIHESPMVSPFYHQLFHEMKHSLSIIAYYPLMLGAAFIIGVLCILIDKIRIWVWDALLRLISEKGERA